jgi:threonine/homoserine/homoserine lactone efflux protein
MLTFQELLLFALAAFVLVISPGPNMIYLISARLPKDEWQAYFRWQA